MLRSLCLGAIRILLQVRITGQGTEENCDMERFRKLSEVIESLLRRGYTIDFDQLTKGEIGFYQAHVANNPSEDFRVDEIFCCSEKFDTDKAIYVFAISSDSHHFKGILINGYSGESIDFWNAFAQTLEKLKSSLSQLLSTHELSSERQ